VIVGVIHPLLGLLIAAVLGGAVGVQRQAAHKAAGFRTHLLVALGSCAFTQVGAHLGDTRIAANVLTGIGFLGAGAIVRAGLSARGLTTAASIWTVAAIGLAIGFGTAHSIQIGVATTVVTLVALSFTDRALYWLLRFPRRVTIDITYQAPTGSESAISDMLRRMCRASEVVDTASITASDEGEVVQRHYLVVLGRNQDLGELVHEITSLPGVQQVTAAEPSQSG
jgi:putative Mg2+ transporter-C (MgtC) family protein